MWTFRTATDPGDPLGEQRNQTDAMPVAVHRRELQAARDRLTYALLGSLPDLLRPYVARLFAPYLDGLESRISALLNARGSGPAYLIFHGGRPPTPAPSGPCAGRVPPGIYTGTNTNDFRERIPMTGGALVDHDTATGPVSLSVAPDGTLTGTWSFTMHDVFDESFRVAGISSTHHAVRTYTMTGGTIGGTACDATLTSGRVHQISCTGDCADAAADPPAGTLPRFGPPKATAGNLTWTKRSDAADGHYTDTFTIAVAGPR